VGSYSRNTVRKVLRSTETSFSYEREVQPRPKLVRWREDLDRLLAANAGASARERLTLIRLFEELRALGYEGGYDAVRRYARNWSKEHASATASAFVPLSFAPGEAYQFDWSHEIVVLNGVTTTVKAAHVRLCHSRMMLVRTYPRETQEMVFDAHERAFAFFKGACRRGIYDNMKTAVETIFIGKDRQYNRRFLQMCSHHLVEPVACTPVSTAAQKSASGAARREAGAGSPPATPPNRSGLSWSNPLRRPKLASDWPPS
jgi:transposase